MNPMTPTAVTESICIAVDEITAETRAALLLGRIDQAAFEAKMETVKRFRDMLIPHVESGKPSRPIRSDDVESAIRGMALRAFPDRALEHTASFHRGRLAFASQVITQAVREEQHRRSVLRAE